mgnify:FL=1
MLDESAPTQPINIRRRAVFVLPGYDPAPPRRYREIYRREAALQGVITGQSLTLSAAERPAPFYGWQVKSRTGTVTDFWLLPWNDLVRSSISAGVFGIYALAGRAALTYLRGGAFFALLRLRWQPMLAVLYPLAILLAQILIAVGLVALGAEILGPIGAAIGACLAYAGAEALRRRDARHYTYYLLHLYAFAAQNAAQPNAELTQRMRAFSREVQSALADGVDEVLIVGHSLGAQLAVDLLADMLRRGQLPRPGRVGLLTLGQVIPMISFLPSAKQLRRNLHDLAASDRVFWLDVSSQADGGCFALADPVAVTGVSLAQSFGPKVISAAFSETVTGAEKQRFFDRHFQYYKAFARPEKYDYFALTAGDISLEDRFSGRNNSPQLNQKIYSKQTDMADE